MKVVRDFWLRPVTRRLQRPLLRIVAEIRHQVPVLIAVRHHQRGGLADIALFDQQRHDGVRRDRVQTRRWANRTVAAAAP